MGQRILALNAAIWHNLLIAARALHAAETGVARVNPLLFDETALAAFRRAFDPT